MQQLGFGRFEFVPIARGELVLDPWPTTVRNIKFGASKVGRSKECPPEFELKKQVAEFFQHIRSIEGGEIRTLAVHNGLPFTMEIEHQRELSVESPDA
jgi:hypothetical protein